MKRKEGRKHPQSLFTQDLLPSTGEKEINPEEAGGWEKAKWAQEHLPVLKTNSQLFTDPFSGGQRGPCDWIRSAHLGDLAHLFAAHTIA